MTRYGLGKTSATPVRITVRFSYIEKVPALAPRETRLHAKVL